MLELMKEIKEELNKRNAHASQVEEISFNIKSVNSSGDDVIYSNDDSLSSTYVLNPMELLNTSKVVGINRLAKASINDIFKEM
jgi:hypothetical protein